MPKRRAPGSEPPKPFTAAFQVIDQMEQAVVYRTVTTDFTLHDVARWMFPEEVIQKLQAAYPYVRTNDRSSFSMRYTDYTPVPGCSQKCRFEVNLPQINMLCPAFNYVQFSRNPDIEQALQDMERIIVGQFDKVRQVVTWLNQHATVGAARYYFPSLASLLPAGHAIHDRDGQRYQEPKQNLAEIVPVMREASAIIATGLLSDPNNIDTHKRISFIVDFEASNQTFGLL